ncbi:hypothetical protein HanPSC8_Chr17g0791791 [Helianthus annuus]|nr:hypothetical protein HanPSC8_Chr17g0791791 [Helianthus annuus]
MKDLLGSPAILWHSLFNKRNEGVESSKKMKNPILPKRGMV